MSLAEKLIEQGMQKGLREGELKGLREGELKGKLEIAERMLSEGSDPAFVEKVTSLSLAQIKKMAKNMN